MLRKLLAPALLLAALTPLLAADKEPAARPNTLTPAEIRDGWLLLFDGETTFGWKIDGEARVEKGVLILGGKKETKAEISPRLETYDFRCQAAWTGEAPPAFNHSGDKLIVRRGKPGEFNEVSSEVAESGRGLQPFVVTVAEGQTLRLQNVKVRPLGLKPIFNGKNLTGWNLYTGKGKKSTFSVTAEGWLNVKNGPGDLQTTGLYDDFVLQLECISNGKHLNSGIFFRAIPDQYQQGYEAQIRNQFHTEADQKYTIEDYDPKTNKLIGKRTMMSPAVDYGTGAIYRRMPARKEVARDGEWFTMTVIARGRHLATWVNGYPEVDWIDNRPAAENARNGYRAEKGAISIQGHDPTTDLSFRNFRIVGLPKGGE
jgi:hypothetical protein